MTSQIWKFEEWESLPLKDVKDRLVRRAYRAPKLGDMKVWDLCSLALNEMCYDPVGLYVFLGVDNDIQYVGKTHGRSLHERMISHIDHRDPVSGSPHLARLVQSLIKSGEAMNGTEGVGRLLHMRVLWLPIPKMELSSIDHKKFIALIERRLLWHRCLDPKFNSERVKRNDTFTLKGTRHMLDLDTALGERL
jgi:hypothetical protein